MNCPTCSLVRLTQKSIGSVTILHCESCDGIFLHHGELKKITYPIVGDIEYSSLEYADFSKKSGFLCSACDDGEILEHRSKCTVRECQQCIVNEMIYVNFVSFSDVKMTYCPRCGGIWLAKGTLDLINKEIEKLNHDKDNWEYILASFLSKLPF